MKGIDSKTVSTIDEIALTVQAHEKRLTDLETKVNLSYDMLVKIKNRLVWFTGIIVTAIGGSNIF